MKKLLAAFLFPLCLSTSPVAAQVSVINVVPDFCTASNVNGTTDNTACVQAAFTAACTQTANTGAEIHFQSAHFKAHDISVPCSVHVSGVPSGQNLNTGTVWDYTGATGSAIAFQPAAWPAVGVAARIYAPVIEGITFFASSSTSKIIVMNGVDSGVIRQIQFTGNAYNGIYLYGDYRILVEDVNYDYYNGLGSSLSNNFIEIYGDLAGQSCTLGGCVTRTDLVTLRNVSTIGGSTGFGIFIHGLVDTTVGEHVSVENKSIALVLSCPSGFPNISYCPQFTTFTDFQGEGATNESAYLNDTSNFRCLACYFVTAGSGTNNAVDISYSNYNNGGNITIDGAIIGASGNTGIFDNGVNDLMVTNSRINNANINQYGAAGIYFNAKNGKFTNNTFCTTMGSVPTLMGAVSLGSSAVDVTLDNSNFRGCTSGVTGTTAGGQYYNTNYTGP